MRLQRCAQPPPHRTPPPTSVFTAVGKDMAVEFISVFTTMYPERMGTLVLFEPPTVLEWLMTAIKPFMDASTVRKIITVRMKDIDSLLAWAFDYGHEGAEALEWVRHVIHSDPKKEPTTPPLPSGPANRALWRRRRALASKDRGGAAGGDGPHPSAPLPAPRRGSVVEPTHATPALQQPLQPLHAHAASHAPHAGSAGAPAAVAAAAHEVVGTVATAAPAPQPHTPQRAATTPHLHDAAARPAAHILHEAHMPHAPSAPHLHAAGAEPRGSGGSCSSSSSSSAQYDVARAPPSSTTAAPQPRMAPLATTPSATPAQLQRSATTPAAARAVIGSAAAGVAAAATPGAAPLTPLSVSARNAAALTGPHHFRRRCVSLSLDGESAAPPAPRTASRGVDAGRAAAQNVVFLHEPRLQWELYRAAVDEAVQRAVWQLMPIDDLSPSPPNAARDGSGARATPLAMRGASSAGRGGTTGPRRTEVATPSSARRAEAAGGSGSAHKGPGAGGDGIAPSPASVWRLPTWRERRGFSAEKH